MGDQKWPRCSHIDISRVSDPRGLLGFVNLDSMPFVVERLYFHSAVPIATTRGAHGHVKLQQVLVALSGRFTTRVIGQWGEETHVLTPDSPALYLPGGVWRELSFDVPGTVSLVLASERFDPDDYVDLAQLEAMWRG